MQNLDKIKHFRAELLKNAPGLYSLLRSKQLERLSLKRLSLGGQKPTTQETEVGNTALQTEATDGNNHLS
jgi:hypothetical protein